MKQYYIDRSQANGDCEIHHEDCEDLPQMQNRTYLGTFSNCANAMTAAKKYYEQANWCSTCSTECHTE